MKNSLNLSRRTMFSGLSATLALSACAPAGMMTAPKTDLPERFAAESPTRRVGGNVWWAAFRDSHLDAMIATGLRRNLDVQTAVTVIREAQANARLVGARGLPHAEIGAAANRGNSDGGGIISESTSATLGISWLIDIFGQNRAARKGASAQLDAAYFSADVARPTMTSAIATAYVDARYYQEALALTRQSLESRRRTLSLTRQQGSLGSMSRVEILQAEQLVTQAEVALPALEVGRDQSINRLATLTAGRSTYIATVLRQGAAQPRVRYRASVGVPADVIRARPDIRVSESNLTAAIAGVGEATAAFYPKLTLAGNVTPINLSGGGNMKTWGFGPENSVPLFSGGANRARLSAAEARAEQARLAWQASILNAVEEVENALAGYNRDPRVIGAQTRLVTIARESVSLAQSSYELGQSEFFPVLDAERTLLSAKHDLANAVRQQAQNFVALSVASARGVGMANA